VEWPYPVNYEKTHHVKVDVLVIGGGLAGCTAGISACKRGLQVAIVDKAPIKRSGCGGAGMDHWNGCLSNPKSPVTPEEFMELPTNKPNEMGHTTYIFQKTSWEALTKLEELGLPIRDENGDFEGAPVLDEDLKVFKGFDYEHVVNIKLRGGHYIKPVLYDGVKNAGAKLYERIMITCLLTEGGRQGAKVAGATGFSMETGEFYVFEAKSVIITTGYITGVWIYSGELTGNSYRWDPNEVGDGFAIAWNAGAQVTGMHKNGSTHGANPFAWPRFGVGNPDNTWFPCTIVDNNGKVIPWEDVNGNPVESIEARNKAVDGQIYISTNFDRPKGIRKPLLIHDLPQRIRDGEYELPLWADLSGMPEAERRQIWGMMVGNEGKTRYTLFDYYTRLGFDPDQDMLWVPVMEPEHYGGNSMDWFQGEPDVVKPWRSECFGGQGHLVVDWTFMTNVPGLFAAGAAAGMGSCAMACSSGFYTGNRAAEYAMENTYAGIDSRQLAAEKERVYAPIKRAKKPENYVSWKEIWGGTTRVMQVCCGEYKTIPVLQEGLDWIASIREQEMQMTYARNPHELARVLEGETRATVSEAYLHACIEKIKADREGLQRNQYLFNQLVDGAVVSCIKDKNYWLQEPYAPTYLENYEKYRAKERSV
jgi:succinate dehydrogenase/fumarate reductase flavoprotein subunit